MKKSKTRLTIYGQPIVAAIHFLGKAGLTLAQAEAVLAENGIPKSGSLATHLPCVIRTNKSSAGVMRHREVLATFDAETTAKILEFKTRIPAEPKAAAAPVIETPVPVDAPPTVIETTVAVQAPPAAPTYSPDMMPKGVAAGKGKGKAKAAKKPAKKKAAAKKPAAKKGKLTAAQASAAKSLEKLLKI